MMHLKSTFRMRHRQIGLIHVREQGLDLELWDGGSRPRWSMGVVLARADAHEPNDRIEIPTAQRWLLVLPTHLCTTRHIQLPANRPEEIAAMLEFEVPQLTPCSTQAWTWDFCVTKVQEDGASQVLVVMSPLSVVESALEQARALGVEPSLVTVAAALDAVRSGVEEHKRHGCLSWDHGSLDFAVQDGSRLEFLRGVRVFGRNSHALEYAEMEMRRNLAMLGERGVDGDGLSIRVGGTDPDVSSLVERLKQSAMNRVNPACTWEFHDGDSSGGATKGIRRQQRLRNPCINLLPQDRKEKDRRAARRRELLGTGLRVCVLALLMLLCLRMSSWRQTRLLEQYQERIAKIAPLAEKLQFLQGQLNMIQTQVHGNVSMLDIISQLYEVLPQDVTVHYLGIDQGRQVVIRAQAKWLSQAFDAIDPLEQSPYLANVRQSYAHLRELEGQVLIDFELRADLEKRSTKEAKP